MCKNRLRAYVDSAYLAYGVLKKLDGCTDYDMLKNQSRQQKKKEQSLSTEN
jgi:hypothetical protein